MSKSGLFGGKTSRATNVNLSIHCTTASYTQGHPFLVSLLLVYIPYNHRLSKYFRAFPWRACAQRFSPTERGHGHAFDDGTTESLTREEPESRASTHFFLGRCVLLVCFV